MWSLRKRVHYRVVIKGLESGNVTELPWLTFSTQEAAATTVGRLNTMKAASDADPPLTVFEYREINE